MNHYRDESTKSGMPDQENSVPKKEKRAYARSAQRDAYATAVTFGLRRLSERLKPAEIEELTGIPASTLYKYLKDESPAQPSGSDLALVCAAAGISVEQLITGDVAPERIPDQEKRTSLAPVGENAILLPRYDVRASAGAGALVVSENISEYMTVGKDWLRRNLPAWAPSNAVVGVLENGGDSMEPTIRDGDLLMVVQDVEWRIVERGGIFVFSVDDQRLLLKRLQVLMNGDLRIISDNPAYAPETIVFDDIQHRIRIHGQVFFAGGRPR